MPHLSLPVFSTSWWWAGLDFTGINIHTIKCMIVTMVTGCVDLVYTYIDKDGMDVVRMFPLKKNTPAVSYRGGGGGRRYSKLIYST